jgi:hypothetical protein
MTTEIEIGSEELEDKEFSQQGEAESVEDTILRSIEELEGDGSQADESLQGDQGQGDEETKLKASEAARVLAAQKKPKKQVIEAKDLQPEKGVKKGRGEEGEQPGGNLEAPVGWDVKDKEEFAKLPEAAKRQSLAFWGRMNKVFTQGTQELSRYKQKYGELEEVETFYKPHLDSLGLNFGQTTKELLATHVKLMTDTDAELLRVIQRSGRSLESLYNFREGKGGAQQFQAQPPASPQNAHLTPDVVSSIVRQELQGYQYQQASNSEAEELEALRNERDQDGRYLYPELWDSENMAQNYWNTGTIEGLKPLYESFRKTQPGISAGEATRRALTALRLMKGEVPSSPSPQAQRLPNTNDIAKARAASVSIRSRGNHSMQTTSQAPTGQTVEQSIAAAIAELGGNSQY